MYIHSKEERVGSEGTNMETGGEAPRAFEFDATTTDRQPTFYLMTILMKMCMVVMVMLIIEFWMIMKSKKEKGTN